MLINNRIAGLYVAHSQMDTMMVSWSYGRTHYCSIFGPWCDVLCMDITVCLAGSLSTALVSPSHPNPVSTSWQVVTCSRQSPWVG